MTPKHPAIDAFQNIDAARWGILIKQEILDTRVNARLGNTYVSAEFPRDAGKRVAADVSLALETALIPYR